MPTTGNTGPSETPSEATPNGNNGSASRMYVSWTVDEPPRVPTFKRLCEKPRLTVAFPECADELLALINPDPGAPYSDDAVTKSFNEYLAFERHVTLGQRPNGNELNADLPGVLAGKLLDCTTGPILEDG